MQIDKFEKFGYCVTGVDYYSKEDAQQLKQLVGESRLVCIRNENPVEPEALVTLYRNIGRVAVQNEKVRGSGVGGFGELVQVKSDGLFQGKEDGELVWHNAVLQKSDGEDIVGMYMHHIADEGGGDTYFSDAQTAYDDLDEDLKQKLDTLVSKTIYYPMSDDGDLTNVVKNTHIQQIFPDFDTFKEWKDVDGNVVYSKQVKTKPLVTEHHINGKKGLDFPYIMLRGFLGMPKEESNQLYKFLCDHVMKDKYVYRHQWNQYDVCLSDQVHSLHKRDAYNGYRELWRAGIWTR
jgi:alpha-ketoglutarate-dependent taurine dioxygenase